MSHSGRRRRSVGLYWHASPIRTGKSRAEQESHTIHDARSVPTLLWRHECVCSTVPAEANAETATELGRQHVGEVDLARVVARWQ